MKFSTKGRLLTAVMLALLTVCTFVLASCDMGSSGSGFLESIPDLNASDVESVADESSEEPTPEGYTQKPTVDNIVNTAPSTVVIAGNCEDGAVVSVKGGKETVSVVSTNGYYITTIEISGTSTVLLEITAKVEGKEESLPLSAVASYSAVAESRVDGMSVTVGKESHLYFDKMVDDYIGANLLTQTQLREFKTFVNGKVTACSNRANGEAFDLIYVLIPDSTSIYDEYLDDSIVRTTHQTRYEQISEAIGQTNALVIDMYDTFMAAKDGEYPIYRTSDSHLTEYGAYLVTKAICDVFAEQYPAAAAHPLTDYTIGTKTVCGGDLVSFLGINKSVVSEDVPTLTPTYSLDIGDGESKGFETTLLSSVKVYTSGSDYSIDTSKAAGTSLARLYFRTGDTELPTALVYRDEYSANVLPFLAERLQNSMFGLSGDYTINLTDAGRHNREGKNIVDYVIVIASESNIEDILG